MREARCARRGRLRRMRTASTLALCLLIASSGAAQTVVRYEPKEGDLKYVFGVAEPVARVKPGDIIDTKTFDCFGNVIQKPGDTLAKVKGDNPLTGPFFVEGAEPGDTLVVKILELTVDSNQGVAALAPGFRRAQRDQLHADAARAGAGEDLVLSDRSGEERGDVQRARLDGLHADSPPSVPRLPGRRARPGGAELGHAGRARGQHGRAGSERRQHRLLPRQRARGAALSRRRPRGDGRRRDRGHRDRGPHARARAGRRHQGTEDRRASRTRGS